ncbi:glycosyltransferase family 4 protein [Rhizobium straminoryzae]|uniref:Glycosyltransferase family 4 protein n=1 Tax=Rhizobium straminoryzae TaxID=1387186 RepID=A0A549TBA7_9HYPH|nr:glycosyltransferase family 4 protein [Rhizobium straminoryzae]TRL39172.1 glycosyltransferase family 4 protein [Rhizobium straminoryzae]
MTLASGFPLSLFVPAIKSKIMDDEMSKLATEDGVPRGLCLSPRWFIRPKNTDWLHTVYAANLLTQSSKRFTLELDKRAVSVGRSNYTYIRKFLLGRALGRSAIFTPYEQYPGKLPGYDFFYSYGTFPTDAPSGARILWHDGPTDVDVLMRRGLSVAEVDRCLRAKRDIAQVATRLAMSSEYSKQLFCQQFEVDAARVDVLPFVLPFTQAIDDERLTAKHVAGPIKILFVGRAARRKGLDLLVTAFQSLRARGVEATLTIVSEMQDGPVALPDDPAIELLPALPPLEIQRLMSAAHIFAMPSREESYGIVYIEALAAGAVPIAPDKPQQRMMLQNGDIGCLVSPSPDDIAERLVKLSENNSLRLEMARRGVEAFTKHYSKAAVLERFEQAFDMTLKG